MGSFLVLGFVGVLLLRSSLRYRSRSLASFVRGFGWLFCCMSLHGFLVTYLYVNHLRDEGASVPLAATILAWVVAAPYSIKRGRHIVDGSH